MSKGFYFEKDSETGKVKKGLMFHYKVTRHAVKEIKAVIRKLSYRSWAKLELTPLGKLARQEKKQSLHPINKSQALYDALYQKIIDYFVKEKRHKTVHKDDVRLWLKSNANLMKSS